jgi:hypothetical protein
VNRDGILDLVLPTYKRQFTVLLGNGDGTFQPQQTFGQDYGSSLLALADVNQDGNLDVITASPMYLLPPDVTVFLGDGTGSFNNRFKFGVCCDTTSLLVTDVNHDGLPDVIVGGLSGLAVLINTPSK